MYSLDDGHQLDMLSTPGFGADHTGIALDPTGQLVALSSQVGRHTQLWDLQTRRLIWSIEGEAGPLDWSPKGDRIAIAGANQSPIGWSTPTRVASAWCSGATRAGPGTSPSPPVVTAW